MGGPHSAARVQTAHDWATTARAYDLVFVQELPSQAWLDEWSGTHHVIAPNNHGYLVRSALLVSKSLEFEPLEFPTASYHDSYVAAAAVVFPDGREVACLSVHASPSRVTPEWRTMWEKTGVEFPPARDGEPLWDADLLLASVVALAKERSLLVAGDWNEARAWDDSHPGTAGAEFFRRVDEAGLVDCTWQAWRKEIATCQPEGSGGALQLDHVFATPDVTASVSDFNVKALAAEAGSDHSPIEFRVSERGSGSTQRSSASVGTIRSCGRHWLWKR